jgi:hypothetical protein
MATPAYNFSISESNFGKRLFSDKEFVKEAQALFTNFILDKVREYGVTRDTIGVRNVRDDELVELDYTDQPAYMFHRDFDANAMTVSLLSRGTFNYHQNKKFLVFFEKIVSDKIRKSEIELKASSVDYKKLIEKRISEAMYTKEDIALVDGANKIVTDEWEASKANHVVTDDYEKSKQLIKFKKGVSFDKDSLVDFTKLATQNQLDMATLLMTRSMLQDTIKMSMLEVGDANVSKLWQDGVSSIKKFWGKKIVTTIKNDIVKDNEIFGFVPSEMFGYLLILKDHTTYIEVDRDMFTIDSDAYLSLAIGNTKGVYKAVFEEN